ncbi:hypothetical protein [Altererythrobacter lutimaris]|uniref:Uncharacterized protein n=1 Tax=Altererythrobacter lutimaris TaxID=2743979 RepID=A0A850H9G7_9SPHN|nr:hypothetical protein [Altererythrobacter lutimaris]NVE95964.1 hypothetical protein [Altererythrobacter lutimaris]
MIRLIAFLFLGLTFLAGITVATIEYALINCVIFCALALGVIRFIEPRYGEQGLVYGMAGAFFVSFLWPYALIISRMGSGCVGDECLAAEPPASQSPSGASS